MNCPFIRFQKAVGKANVCEGILDNESPEKVIDWLKNVEKFCGL